MKKNRDPQSGTWLDIALEGEEAILHMARLGWTVNRSQGVFRLFADVIAAGPFGVARVWHTPATLLSARGDETGDQRFLALLSVEGTKNITTPTGSHILQPGDVAITSLRAPVEISTTEPAASIVIVSQWDRLTSHRSSAELLDEPWAGDEAYLRVLINLVNAALGAGIPVDSAGFSSLRAGIEALLSAVILQREPVAVADASSAERALLQRAIAVIDERSSDPAFSVDALLAVLYTSPSYLHQVFRKTGTTPAKRIRFSRAATARALLSMSPATSDEDLARVASASGFRTVRSMQRALLDGVATPVTGRAR